MTIVAALYIDPRGPYPTMAAATLAELSKFPDDDGWHSSTKDNCWNAYGIDCWDEARDARLYDGPHPIVAHPPCGPWGRLRHLYRGNEHDCAPRAVEQVRAFGGVLEHPAGSKLWEACELPKPSTHSIKLHIPRSCYCLAVSHSCAIDDHWREVPQPADAYGYTIEVDQCEWGHACRKRTWLYVVGVPREVLEAPPFPGRAPTHWCSGGRTGGSRNGSPIPPGIKAASGQIKRRTPPLFAEYLVRLARFAKKT